MTTLEALRRLVEQVEDTISNSEGRWPLKVPGCQFCTDGNTPYRYDTGPCGYHAAKQLIAREDAYHARLEAEMRAEDMGIEQARKDGKI